MKTTIEVRGADGRMIQSSRFSSEHKGTGAKVNPFAVQQVQLVLKYLLFLAENAVGGDCGATAVVARINP